MSDTCPIVQITDAKAPGGFVEINESDFDPKIHKLFKAEEPKKEVKPVKDKAEK